MNVLQNLPSHRWLQRLLHSGESCQRPVTSFGSSAQSRPGSTSSPASASRIGCLMMSPLSTHSPFNAPVIHIHTQHWKRGVHALSCLLRRFLVICKLGRDVEGDPTVPLRGAVGSESCNWAFFRVSQEKNPTSSICSPAALLMVLLAILVLLPSLQCNVKRLIKTHLVKARHLARPRTVFNLSGQSSGSGQDVGNAAGKREEDANRWGGPLLIQLYLVHQVAGTLMPISARNFHSRASG